MNYINNKCPNCGAVLEINKEEGTAYCRYCSSKFEISDSIDKNIVNLNGSVLVNNATINVGSSAVNLFSRGKEFEQLGNYEKAEEYYNKALDVDVSLKQAREAIDYLIILKLLKGAKKSEDNGYTGLALKEYKDVLKLDSKNEMAHVSVERLRKLLKIDKNKVLYDAEGFLNDKKCLIEVYEDRICVLSELKEIIVNIQIKSIKRISYMFHNLYMKYERSHSIQIKTNHGADIVSFVKKEMNEKYEDDI